LFGLPVAMAFLGMQDDGRHAFTFTCLLLQLPAIYLPFLIAFLPRADQEGTAWVFEQAPGLNPAIVRDATWRALISHVLVPVHGLAFALLAVWGDVAEVAVASAFSLGLGVVAARSMVSTLECVPFTRDRDAEAALDMGRLMASALVLGGAGVAFAAFLPPAGRWAAAVVAAGAAGAMLGRLGVSGGAVFDLAPAATAGAGKRPEPDGRPLPEVEHFQRDPGAVGEHRPALARELRAIALLYAAVCVLPFLIGTMFAP
jgi:hypothetical protein